MSRQGQVWEGPIDSPHAETEAHLVLWPSVYDEHAEKHETVKLNTGERSQLLMKDIENDGNWRRLA